MQAQTSGELGMLTWAQKTGLLKHIEQKLLRYAFFEQDYTISERGPTPLDLQRQGQGQQQDQDNQNNKTLTITAVVKAP